MSISEAYFIDNLKYMKMVNDNYFDLVIADPPYGINAPNNKNGSHPTRKNGPSTSTTEKLKGRLNSGSGKLKNRILNQSNFDCAFDACKNRSKSLEPSIQRIQR